MLLAYETTQEWNFINSYIGFGTKFNVLGQVFHFGIDGKICEDTREKVVKEENVLSLFKHLIFQAHLQLYPCSLALVQ